MILNSQNKTKQNIFKKENKVASFKVHNSKYTTKQQYSK